MSDKPEFDFSGLSHRDSKALGRTQLRLQRLTAQLADSVGLSDDEFEAKMDQLDELVTEAEEVISRILVSVPHDWLVPGAPDDLNWRDVTALEWLRSDKMTELREAAIEARDPQAVSGN
ncbi:MAG: hypothetical protein M5U29_11465 [Anaerolineae bacterium]|nr:hypothetical protein [Anaerolineae bacterium]